MADETTDPSESLTLEQARELLRHKTVALLKADAASISSLTREIQTLRVIVQMLQEIEMQVSDPNTYREMSLLSRMVSGQDLEAEAEKARLEEDTDVQRRLEERGLKPDSALRIARVLQSVMGATKEVADDEGETKH